MKNERKLPEIKIDNRLWLVDVEGYQIIDKENPENRISALDMEYLKDGYRFLYSVDTQTLENLFVQPDGDFFFVNLFHFTEMDPEGVAKLYNLPVSAVKNKSDFEIMTDKQVVISRLQGKLPSVDIFGDEFYIFSDLEVFIPKSDYLEKEIEFMDVVKYYNHDTKVCEFPYNFRTKQIENIDRENILAFPPYTVVIALPEPAVIDPVGYAIAYDIRVSEMLERNTQNAHTVGKVVKDSWLNKQIEENLKKNKMKEAKKTRRPQRRMRG